MNGNRARSACVALAAVVVSAAGASAQAPVGGRAAGMAGAFVAVADDSSSVYWNPAGLATGAYVSFELALGGESAEPAGGPALRGPAARRGVRLIAAGTPPLGLSFYRLTSAVAPVVQVGEGRQDGRRRVTHLRTDHVGVTLLQSLADGLAVGATVKLVRGVSVGGSSDGATWDALLDDAAALDGAATTRADVDIGVMWASGRFRLGLAARNLTAPAFGPPGSPDRARLDRHVRAGAAWGSGWPGTTRLIVSADADLTRVPDPSGDRRDVAGGVETWWLGQRLGVRAGARASATGAARPAASGGLSVAVRSGVYLDAHLTRGRGGVRGWGVAARLVY